MYMNNTTSHEHNWFLFSYSLEHKIVVETSLIWIFSRWIGKGSHLEDGKILPCQYFSYTLVIFRTWLKHWQDEFSLSSSWTKRAFSYSFPGNWVSCFLSIQYITSVHVEHKQSSFAWWRPLPFARSDTVLLHGQIVLQFHINSLSRHYSDNQLLAVSAYIDFYQL